MQCVRIKIVFALYNTPECGKKLKTCAIQKWSCNFFQTKFKSPNPNKLHKHISNFTQLTKTTHVPIKSKLHILQKLKQMDCSFICKLWIAVTTDKNKHPLRSITEGHGCKIHYTDPKERDTMAYNGKKTVLPAILSPGIKFGNIRISLSLYRASMTIKTLYYPTDAQIYNL